MSALIPDPVAARASAKHIARCAAEIISDTAIATRDDSTRTYRDSALFYIGAVRKELDLLERQLLGKPEQIEAAPRAA